MIALIMALAALVLTGVLFWIYRNWPAPPPLTAPVALRYLLMCLACLLLSLAGVRDALMGGFIRGALALSVLFCAALVEVLVAEVRRA